MWVLVACASVDTSPVPSTFHSLATLPDPSGTQLAADGDTLALLGDSLTLVDLATYTELETVSLLPGRALDVQVGAGMVWVGYESTVSTSGEAGPGGVSVQGLGAPGTPVAWIGDPIRKAHSLLLDGDTLYVADPSANAVHVFDVHDPAAPTWTADWADVDPDGGPDELALDGSRLYVGARTGLAIVDVSGAPATVGWAPYTEGTLHDVVIADAMAYTSDESDGGSLVSWDVADPTAPRMVATLEPTLHPMIHSLAIDDGVLFAAWYEDGLQAWTLDGTPTLTDTVDACDCEPADPARGPQAVWAGGGRIASADAGGGLSLWEFASAGD